MQFEPGKGAATLHKTVDGTVGQNAEIPGFLSSAPVFQETPRKKRLLPLGRLFMKGMRE
jgi:hypothetical protein